jgi:hypothetical protein
MKITTLLLSLTACVFAAGYVVFAPPTNDVPARAGLETPLENAADSGKPDRVAAVPARAKEVLVPPVQQARAVKKNDDVTFGEKAIAQTPRSPKAEQLAPPKPAAPAPPATADKSPKQAPGGLAVPPGHQAVLVEPTQWVARSSTNVGSRVNVFATTRDEDGKPRSKIILRDVLVLAEDHGRVDENGAALPWRATLAVAKADLPAIEEAKRSGPVSITAKLFRPEDVGPPAPPAPPTLNGPVIIADSPNLPTIITGSPNLPVIITESPPDLPKIIEGPR